MSVAVEGVLALLKGCHAELCCACRAQSADGALGGRKDILVSPFCRIRRTSSPRMRLQYSELVRATAAVYNRRQHTAAAL